MNNLNSSTSPSSAPAGETGFSPWQRLKNKRISYLTIPLLIMATITEFVILATGWKYQQVVCLPHGMGVTFFGIGPIGATILAVELLKLPIAIWTASRTGWAKTFMLFCGLPLICVLTFQLVKDMAVYEMGVAMQPASEMLEKASAEETKISQLNGELAAIEKKKADRETKLAEFAAKKAKAKADFEESLKRNESTRQDAITLTDYQKKELSEVDMRQSTIIAQFNNDSAQINKSLADLRAQREVEVGRASKWNIEEARIENAYKAKLADYTNRKTAYEKDKAEYEHANFLKRQLMKEPIDPGVPPEREANMVLKPTAVAEIDTQIQAKEAELLAISNKRRERVAQVDADARKIREEFDRRSGTKREDTDRKREELTAAYAALEKELKAEEKQVDADLAASVQKVDGIRSELDGARKRAEGFYEAREASIRNTQVHRIATTVEIVRGLFKGERPMSIKASAKERGDILTDQISMVRIWVYPVLAFIVAFLPTLMVEIGFSTVFKPEQVRAPHRLGFFGRRMHWLYKRAGAQKILRAERIAREATAEITKRDEAVAAANARTAQVVLEKEAEVHAVHAALDEATAQHEAQLKKTEEEWVAKFSGVADALNQANIEKDTLRDFQKSEIERQVQARQNAWSERLGQMRQELDTLRTSTEAERLNLSQEHHKRLLEMAEDCKNQVSQARRQAAEGELAAQERTAKLAYELKEALNACDEARAQLQQQTEAYEFKLTQAREDAAREIEKGVRQEKHRAERQQLEFNKTLRQATENFEHQLKQQEQQLTLEADTRLAAEQAKLEQDGRRRAEEFERQLETRVREVDARWNLEAQQREEAAQIRLKQREQQLQAQADARVNEVQMLAGQESRRREAEFERQLETQAREASARLKQELQQKELEYQSKLKQRDQELTTRASARENELQGQWGADLRVREEAWERQAEARVRATEARLAQEAQAKEEVFQTKLRQRDQQWQAKLDAARADQQAQNEQALRRVEAETEAGQRALRELETHLRKEMAQKEEAATAKAKQREQELTSELTAQAEVLLLASDKRWEKEMEKRVQSAVEPLKTSLARTERERDEAKHSAATAVSQLHDLEKKLTEASTFLNGWKNGRPIDLAAVGRS